jgi:hypothetical protein
MKLNNTIWRILLVSAGLGILSFLVYKNIVPSGRYFVSGNFEDANPAVSVLYPEGRVSSTPDGVIVREEPVYFDVRIPRKFDAARVKVYFEELATPVLELGIEGTPGAKNFNFQPIANKFLDSLDWPKITENGTTLYQRWGTFKGLEDFYRHLPPPALIATYRVPFLYHYKISGYMAESVPREIDPDILGSFKFYTYLKNEPLDFKFTFDAPAGFGDISLRIWSEGRLVLSKDYLDVPGLAGNLKNTRIFHLWKDGLPEGVYRVEVGAPKNVRTASIRTPVRYLTFSGPLVFAETTGSKNILTSARHLYARSSGSGPITLTADGILYDIATPEKRYDIKLPTIQYVLRSVWFDRGNVELDGDGLFAFDWPSFFNPLMQNLDDALVEVGITDYILAGYSGAESGVADFNLKNIAPSESRKIRFVLSLPQLKEGDAGVKIKKVEINFEGEAVGWDWIKNKLGNLIGVIL